MCVCMCVCMCVRVMCVYMCVCMCVCVYVCTSHVRMLFCKVIPSFTCVWMCQPLQKLPPSVGSPLPPT